MYIFQNVFQTVSKIKYNKKITLLKRITVIAMYILNEKSKLTSFSEEFNIILHYFLIKALVFMSLTRQRTVINLSKYI